MNPKILLVLLFSCAMLAPQPVGHAAEDKSVANPLKKKIKETPANPSSPTDGPSDSELTEEEKKMIEVMAKNAPKDTSDVANVTVKESVKLPPSVLAARPPKNPLIIPKAPTLPPKNPNDLIIRIPQPPGRIFQYPNDQTPKAPPVSPNTKKKP